MPSSTPRQAKFMRVAAHNPSFAKEAGISQTVAREFNDADSHAERAPRSGSNSTSKFGGSVKKKTRTWSGA